MKFKARLLAGLATTLTIAGVAFLSGSSAGAAPPAGPLSAGLAGQGSFGSIKGRLVWGGAEAPAPRVSEAKGKARKDPEVCAKDAAIVAQDLVVDPKTKGVEFGVAYLIKPQGTNPEAVKALVSKAARVEIDQKNCVFVPHTTGLHQDQTLLFKSSDPVNHNIHISPFTNVAFNTLIAANGQMEKQLSAERQPIPLTCDIHPWMKGYIRVFDHPFFAVTAADGSFTIEGVPAGAQNLILWQESVGFVSKGGNKGMPVVVQAGQATDVGNIVLDPSKVK